MLKIVYDYFTESKYSVKDTEASQIDDEYNIDLIATKGDEVNVVQIKSGSMSSAEIKKFCALAPKYIAKFEVQRKTKRLIIVAHKLNKNATEVFKEKGVDLLNNGYQLIRVFPEDIINKLPKYSIHFKELKRIHK